MRVESAPFGGEIPRDDLAALLAGVLHDRRTGHHILYVNGGPEPIGKALDAVLTGSP